MPERKNKKIIFYSFIIVFFAGLAYIFFNEFGMLKYWQLKSEVNELNQEIERVEEENKALQAEIDSLKRKEPAKIEKTAREEYGMSRQGEKVIEVIEE